MTSVFDENQLNEGRFISLLENFLSEDTNHSIVQYLVNFIHGGYVETEEEKMERLEKVLVNININLMLSFNTYINTFILNSFML